MKHQKDSLILTIYCDGWCDDLRKLTNILSENKLPYNFEDLRFNKNKFQKLSSLFGSQLSLPVLEIKTSPHEKAAYIKISELLNQFSIGKSFETISSENFQRQTSPS
jgi:arsenate reductase-like glutaredoxin family protein